MSCAVRMRAEHAMGYHVPDWAAPTPTERGQGITAKCAVCGKALYRGVEFITAGCAGERQPR